MKYFLIFALLFFAACDGEARSVQNNNELAIETAGGEKHHFTVELALSPQQLAQGLMNRASMAEDHGMLFYFPEAGVRGFWMKNTLIPLDIIFINEDGTINKIHKNAVPHDLTSLRSDGPVRAALEINAGLSEQLGLREGDQIHHPFFAGLNPQ
jgi:uncharacterized membrane protein (UPF0127 family)